MVRCPDRCRGQYLIEYNANPIRIVVAIGGMTVFIGGKTGYSVNLEIKTDRVGTCCTFPLAETIFDLLAKTSWQNFDALR